MLLLGSKKKNTSYIRDVVKTENMNGECAEPLSDCQTPKGIKINKKKPATIETESCGHWPVKGPLVFYGLILQNGICGRRVS